ncbi:MAG: class I SAM-dependent methyltransferase [Bacteroidetes bacterium]|nr:class I SAM-dependent methyltransferase [Fibrella sp.]
MSFDLIAPLYDTLSRVVFGRSLERAQLVLLPKIPPNSSILLVGGGTGFLLAKLLADCQPTRILFLEASVAMLRRARCRVQHHPLVGRVEFRHGTQVSLQSGEVFGVVIVPFVLDLFPEATLRTHLLPPLLRVTAPGGHWLATDFVNSPRLYHRLVLKTMYRFFRLVSGVEARQLPDWPRLLSEAGLTSEEQAVAAGGQVQTGWWVLT